MIAGCALVAGCQLLRTERVIAPAAVRSAVQSSLGVTLAETEAVSSVATLTDVQATYTAQTPGERILVVVFSAREATVQLTGSASVGGDPIVVHNVVAIYDHDSGTASRRADLRAALRGLDRAAP